MLLHMTFLGTDKQLCYVRMRYNNPNRDFGRQKNKYQKTFITYHHLIVSSIYFSGLDEGKSVPLLRKVNLVKKTWKMD